MSVAAFVISILSALFAAGAMWWTRHEALSTAEALKDARKPTFQVEFQSMNGGGWERIKVTMTSRYSLAGGEIWIKEPPTVGLLFSPSQEGVSADGQNARLHARFGPLNEGESFYRAVSLTADRAPVATLEFRCVGSGNEAWTPITIEVPMPEPDYDPLKSIY